MRPDWFKPRIFLDGGDAEETRKIIGIIGFLDGQTTNPTLVARHPEVQKRLKKGDKFTRAELLDFYKKIVQEISVLIPQGSVSIETYADYQTTAEEILKQAEEMFTWIPNAHIKMPTNRAGLEAAQQAVSLGIRVNMTLCFSQEQAWAVYAATQVARRGEVFVSPFVGRLDDYGENGMDLIANIVRMFGVVGDRHVQVLTASVRSIDHFLCAIDLGSDIVTAPFKILEQWAYLGPVRPVEIRQCHPNAKRIPYSYVNFSRNWHGLNIYHELTDQGIELFSQDWNSLIKS